MKQLAFLIVLLFFSACKDQTPPARPSEPVVVEPIVISPKIIPHWSQNEKGAEFSALAKQMIEAHGQILLSKIPADIDHFCPSFKEYDQETKKDFWVMFLSAMARYESNFNTDLQFREPFNDSKGNRVISRGLLQISIESARGYGCQMASADELHNPAKNLECGVRIMSRWLDRDGLIHNVSGRTWRGSARYWAVLRNNHGSYPKLLKDVKSRCL